MFLERSYLDYKGIIWKEYTLISCYCLNKKISIIILPLNQIKEEQGEYIKQIGRQPRSLM
jgi:hypothetical protein